MNEKRRKQLDAFHLSRMEMARANGYAGGENVAELMEWELQKWAEANPEKILSNIIKNRI